MPAPLTQRSFPDDGCGWVVMRTENMSAVNRPTNSWDWRRGYETPDFRRTSAGVYRSKHHAESLCSNHETTCNLVVWNASQARNFFAQHEMDLDPGSLADLVHYFGSETCRKYLRRKTNGRERNEGTPSVLP